MRQGCAAERSAAITRQVMVKIGRTDSVSRGVRLPREEAHATMDAMQEAEAKRPFTWTDLLQMPEREVGQPYQRHEIIDGELVVTPSPRVRHQQVVLNLTLALAQEIRRLGLGRFF